MAYMKNMERVIGRDVRYFRMTFTNPILNVELILGLPDIFYSTGFKQNRYNLLECTWFLRGSQVPT